MGRTRGSGGLARERSRWEPEPARALRDVGQVPTCDRVGWLQRRIRSHAALGASLVSWHTLWGRVEPPRAHVEATPARRCGVLLYRLCARADSRDDKGGECCEAGRKA